MRSKILLGITALMTMAQSGAVCCKECGCTGTVRCYPVCESPYQWDCEMGCCFDYNTNQCM